MELLVIQRRIYEIRDRMVILDFDLATFYQVETRRLKEQVKRNINRFPEDFMFTLTTDEWKELIANCDNLPNTIKFSPIAPMAFTQEGIAMLSGVLRSEIAVEMSVFIMRAFVAYRQYIGGIAKLDQRLDTFMNETNMQFCEIYQALTELAGKKQIEEKPRNPIGFKQNK